MARQFSSCRRGLPIGTLSGAHDGALRRSAQSGASCRTGPGHRRDHRGAYDKYCGINVKGTLFTVQKAPPLMPEGGAIVINGSMVSVKGVPAFSVYAATKAALRSFART